jgi:glycosyltransferase involved in cell wall biosynthesis
MNSNPLVSVVIPSFNYARYLTETIDSALAQSYPHIEVLVVDDGSSDDSLSVLARYGDRIRYFSQERLGASVARNRGIAEARGEFIALLDSDDAWHPDKIAKQLVLFESARVGLVYSGLKYIDADGNRLGESIDGLAGDVLLDLCLFTPPGVLITGSSALVRKTCFDHVGLFDPAISSSSDWDMWRRLACQFDFAIVREPLTSYRLHNASMRHDVRGYERAMLAALRKTFEDVAATRVHPYRRRCHANLFRILAGGFYRSSQWGSCVAYALRSVWTHPAALGYIAATPFRQIARRARHP